MTPERSITGTNGWGSVLTLMIVSLCSIVYLIYSIIQLAEGAEFNPLLFVGLVLTLVISSVCYNGLFTIEPNEAVVLVLFGKYNGTVSESGFWWVNPLNSKKKVSLRARNFDSDKLKVNDKKGNPIEISAVIVWSVQDTAQAVFDVDDFIEYVHVQSESAIRHLATSYAYDDTEGETVSLRSSIDEVSESLGREIQNRMGAAGVKIEEARINHLAYAPEIAQAMLQRQQAEAVIAARQKIVEGRLEW